MLRLILVLYDVGFDRCIGFDDVIGVAVRILILIVILGIVMILSLGIIMILSVLIRLGGLGVSIGRGFASIAVILFGIVWGVCFGNVRSVCFCAFFSEPTQIPDAKGCGCGKNEHRNTGDSFVQYTHFLPLKIDPLRLVGRSGLIPKKKAYCRRQYEKHKSKERGKRQISRMVPFGEGERHGLTRPCLG